MKTLILVVSLAALAYSQTSNPDPVCLGLRLQDQTECAQQLTNFVADLNTQTFCASQCAVTLRQIYNECGYTGSQNQIALICDSTSIIDPSTTCLTRELQSATACLTLLSGDPTAFCTSDCANEVSTAFTTCGFTDSSNPQNVVCGSGFNLTSVNPVCLYARLSTLSNCALELVTTPSVFCSSQCAQAVSMAYSDCGFTGTANAVSTVCAPGNSIQDPVCVSNRLQNLGGCVGTFLNNVSSFCDSMCSNTLTTAYNDCGYTGPLNPITTTCSNRPQFGGDNLCLTSRLQQLDSCVREITESPTSFCSSDCRTQVTNAYINCGFQESQSPAFGVCFGSPPPGGPDGICLAERLASLQSCVTTFLTYPTTFCSSPCYTDLGNAYTACGYTGSDNPVSLGCSLPSGQDPLCLSRELLNLQDCFSIILTNQTEFCGSNCRVRVSNAFEGCGYANESNPANLCLAGLPSTSVEQCLATRLPTVQGCLTGFTSNPTTFCMTECATNTRNIYQECGYNALFGFSPVDQICSGPSTQDSLCLVYGLQNQTDCLALLLSNSSNFCSSTCFRQVSTAFNNCGMSGFSNPIETTCSAPTQSQDPICLSTRVRSLTSCLAQILTDRGTFCTSTCADQVSSAYMDCGYVGFANPVEHVCSNSSIPSGRDICLQSSTVYQDCLTELSLNPSSFCTSNCVSNINSLFSQCGIPASYNPTTTFCGGLIPNVPGQPSPTCLAEGLRNLQQCVQAITADPANFCGTSCANDLSTAYDECGYASSSNPITLLCNDSSTSSGDLVCLNGALSNAQSCITQLATNPSEFCNSQCSIDLRNAYNRCGFLQSANPVDLACGGGLPGQDPFCISGKLTGLQDCTSKLSDQNFCGSECESDLRTAYSECGFTGTTNPVSILCSGRNGSPNTICLGAQLQRNQECIAELFSNPGTLCSTSLSECATTLQTAYNECGYVGTDNPIGMSTLCLNENGECSQAGTGNGAGSIQALSVVSLTLLLALAAIFY